MARVRGSTLIDTYLLLAETLAAAYEAHVEAHIARRAHRRAKRAEYQLAQWVQETLPDVLLEAEGIDGRLAMMLALLDLSRRHRETESQVGRRVGYGGGGVSGAFETFQARIITSEVLFWLDAWLWAQSELSQSN